MAELAAVRTQKKSMNMVLITMDTHLNSAARRAERDLQKTIPGFSLKIHSASEYATSDQLLNECKNDIAEGDIVIVTMLFLEDHYLPIVENLRTRRDHCDAMLCAMSAGEVTKLTRLSKLDMSLPASPLMALMKKLRPTSKSKDGKSQGGSSAGAKQMKMLRLIPQVLRFVPGTAQDLRAYFLSLQYWLGGSQENLFNLMSYLINRYAAGARASLRESAKAIDPVAYPDLGVYHPRMKVRLSENLQDLPIVVPQTKARGKVGILLLRSYLVSGNSGHYDPVIAALEAQGLQVVPAFSSGLDSRPAIDAFFTQNGAASIDALISLTGFSLVGGPAYNDAKAAEEVLAKLNVPYIAAHPVEFQNLEQWGGSDRGLLPVESTIMVAIPELDGATVPMVYGGRPGAAGKTCHGCHKECTFNEEHHPQDMFTCIERVGMLAARVAKLVDLRRSERAQRKVAIVLFNFPPNAGNIGSAAYLSVFESVHNLLLGMKARGFTVEVPATTDELRTQLLKGNAQQYGADANVHTLIATDDHVKRERWLKEIEAQWGPAPGKQLSNGSSIFVLGKQFGNILLAVQPAFGYEGDPMRLLFEHGFAPTHAFSAFYRYLREDFAANAVVHFGTHGALEFMPGKQTGMSGACWPDRLINDLPNIYLYASNNPSEGAIAKRRSGATLVSYLTPPVMQAGLYAGLADLKASIERWRSLEPEAEHESHELAILIQAQAAAIDLCAAEPLWNLADQRALEQVVSKLYSDLIKFEYTLIPHGLHIVGAVPPLAERFGLLKAMADVALDHPIADAVVQALLDGKNPSEVVGQYPDLLQLGSLETLEDLFAKMIRANLLMSQETEVTGMLDALDGHFIRPAAGGDVMRNPEVLPTGRNLHGFDPFRIPSIFAVKDGAKQAEKIVQKFIADGNAIPESIAMVLWGSDNLKSEGGQIGQALALMGALPRFDSYGRLAGAQLIPLAELGRPRIDVVITLSGIFRDLLPLQIKLLAEAAFMAASAAEPLEQNFIRKHALAYQTEHGCDLETAALRVYGNADGAYGANVSNMVENSVWAEEDELAETYTRRKGFAFGRAGKPIQNSALLKSVLANVEMTYQNLDSMELGVTTIDNYFDTLGGITRAVKRAKGGTDVPVYIGDQTKGDGTVRSLSEQVTLETRTRMLNPKWYEGMLQHGYEGVRQIEVHITNTMGWSATTGQVQPWVYKQLTETFMLDPDMRERLAKLNPTAAARLANRLTEASQRNYWQPDSAMLSAMQEANDELEDRLEGVHVSGIKVAA
ncbi:magnesium chelatase subunit H [Polynucleobacter sp. IMCC 30228]|uniref:magnesium chelatase subunit H n=1 Tax=Polynucleobacter sp. IMCC 30228 TaxID=2781011 RepID=UPI001F22C82D|nr:magnesium chelatase subunit H [Polynucleobacter sp. IMCC 30228]MCE7526138.1 magnesium chelatase subunit H [Polynucleobacter sp. IMCC 30228]